MAKSIQPIVNMRDALDRFYTRQELRAMAIEAGVERGRNKRDTINNLLWSGSLEVQIEMSVKVKK